HWAGCVFDAQGEVKRLLECTGVPLGLDSTRGMPNGKPVTLAPGDLVFLLSDGIIEARSEVGALFGVERARGVVRAHRGESSAEIIAALMREVRDWSPSRQIDDMTAVIIKVAE